MSNIEQHTNKGQDKKKTDKIILQNPDLGNKSERIIVQSQDNKKNERHRNHDKKNERNQVHNKNEQSNRSIFSGHGHDNKKNDQNQEKDIITEVDEAPETKERKVPKDLSDKLGNAGLPRATIAASKEMPEGTPGRPTRKSVLQQHVEFWDTDHDGVITPLDTWKGFRKLGFSLAFSAVAVGIIHGGFSYPTQKSWIPILGNPLFNVYVDTLSKAKHGSDSETFDTEGRFVPEKFEEVFSKYDRDNKGGLSLKDITQVIRGNANVFDPFGWTSAVFEWGTLYLLCEKDGIVYKEDVRSCYDGSLFFKMLETGEKRQKGVPIIKSSATTTSTKEE
ncbi:Caleosin related protein [Rhizophagus diaphanus]|nr:Caleosin related protein [Rhizophagus diaphanus] [Rhizophagus sp. MUCL 43196]